MIPKTVNRPPAIMRIKSFLTQVTEATLSRMPKIIIVTLQVDGWSFFQFFNLSFHYFDFLIFHFEVPLTFQFKLLNLHIFGINLELQLFVIVM